MINLKPIETSIGKDVNALAEIYCGAFIGNDYTSEDLYEAKQTFIKHVTYPGFRGIKYINESEEILGFAYGYTSLPEQFYRNKLDGHLDEIEKNKWLQECFEFVELAVDVKSRQSGIGKQLHDYLLNYVNHDTSILTTSIDNFPAINLYKSREWQIIKRNVVLIPGTEPQIIMGKKLGATIEEIPHTY
ncbi:GNAT family N-acetyltransferase [Virgibacillus necropolis]|uniref:GNAT family N-acetyltransferase n=1 Tax=Virgibacillus necropolis TaxID=163877 RepID=UPI00384F320A